MSTNKTPNLNLHSWLPTDAFSREEFNDNFAAIDTAIDTASLWTKLGTYSVDKECSDFTIPLTGAPNFTMLKLVLCLQTDEEKICPVFVTISGGSGYFYAEDNVRTGTSARELPIIKDPGRTGATITMLPIGVNRHIGILVNAVTLRKGGIQMDRKAALLTSRNWKDITEMTFSGYGSSTGSTTTIQPGTVITVYGLR